MHRKTARLQDHYLVRQMLLFVTVPLGIALILGFGIAATGLTSPVRAQDGVVAPTTDEDTTLTLTAIPPRLGEQGDIRIKPGEKKQVSLQVKNASSQTIQIMTKAEDFIIDEDGKTPVPVSETTSNRWSLASWITIVPTSQLLKPNQLATINALIEVPSDALPGGHYAMITHQPDAAQLLGMGARADSGSGVNQRVGTLLYIVVDGPINEEAFIRNFAFPSFQEMGPLPYSFTVENMSDIHIRPRFHIEISDMLGRRVATIQPESKNIFPLTSRSFSGSWPQIWGTGYYSAVLTMSFGTNGQVVIARTSFWLLPLKLILSGLVLLLILIASLVSIHRHLKHRRQSQTPQALPPQPKVTTLKSNQLKNLED